MHKKASLSLSINAVVVLVLAITMLGLGLGFTKGMFGQLKEQLTVPPPEIPATASDPIVLPTGGELSIKASKDAVFVVNFFNNGPESEIIADIECTGGTLGTSLITAPQTVGAQTYRGFQMIIKRDTFSDTNQSALPLGYNICTVKFYNTLRTVPLNDDKLLENKQIVINAQ